MIKILVESPHTLESRSLGEMVLAVKTGYRGEKQTALGRFSSS